MKTCLHRLLPIAILSLSSLAQPLSAQTPELHNVPNTRNDPVAINIDQSFTPFGNRPITDKTAEDGSVAIRDENGVIIWTDNRGRAVRIPNSSQAKTLFVSNSECVIWQNRYDGTYNARGSNTQIVLYRRDENGAATASPTITIDGTVIDSSPVSPGTYGFTLLAGVSFDTGSLESTQKYQSGVDINPVTGVATPKYDNRLVNAWHDRTMTLYRLTWDGKLQTLAREFYEVPTGSGNIGANGVANGSDGSFFFTDTVAYEKFDDTTGTAVPADTSSGFLPQQLGIWVVTPQDGERIHTVVSSGGGGRLPTGAAHVTNSRLLIETEEGANFRIRDFRKLTNGTISEATAFNLPAGERLLSVADYTRDGLPVRFYTIEDEKDIKLYNADASADATTGYPTIGAVVSLPNKFLSGSAYVRNPRDSSLLLKMDGGSLAWIRGGATGLNAPQALPSSQQAMPLFVSATESVAWMNSGAPPVITPSGVSLPIAKISHFDSSLVATDLTASSSTITSPIAGRYVALTPSLTPDAKDEGWFISTFIKSNDRAAVMRTYTLTTTSLSDADRDALPDKFETKTNTYVSKSDTGTVPTSFDSDGDGLSDGQEVYPFAIIRGSFNWQQARDDAKNRGGRLAVIPDLETYQGLKRLLGGTLVDGAWVAGSDKKIENNWLWYEDWKFPASEDTDAVLDDLSWEAGEPDNLDDADAMWLNPNFYFEDAPDTRVLRYYIIEYRESDPTKKNSDADNLNDLEERVAGSYPKDDDSDDDDLTDSDEVNTHKTFPLVKDSDSDGLDDGIEVKGWLVGSVTYNSDPLLIDTDDDGFDDQAEKIAGTNPIDSQSRPAVPDPTNEEEKKLNKQVRFERAPVDVTIPQPFAPFGTRTTISRFGDDGSAMLVDVNGVLIWRDAAGVNRQIPNSELHIPLVFSNSEAIVWTNGFKSYYEYGGKENVKAAIYRADPVTGAILAPVPITLEGKEILTTAPITTTSQAYHIVTSDHQYNGTKEIIFRIYRITYSGSVQLLGQIRMDTDLSPENSLALTKVLGHGSDGSIIFSQDSSDEGPIYTGPTVVDGVTLVGNTIDYRRKVFWVDGVRPSTVGSGIWETLYDDVQRRNINDGFPDFDFQRVVSTSRTQAVYERINTNGVGEIFEARRNAFTGLMSSKDVKIAGTSDLGRILEISTQTLEGDKRWFYALNKTNTSILVYRLTNTGLVLDCEADIPGDVSIDETATVVNINRIDGSSVIVSDNSPNTIWLRNNIESTSNKKIVVIPNIEGASAKPLFVTKDELVLWNNDGARVLPNGALPPAIITHYWLNPKNNAQAITRLTDKIDGTYVMAVPPFTSPPETGIIPGQYEWPWFFTTVEKTGSATTRFRTYRLQNWNIFDEDGDGLGSAAEHSLGTNKQDPDTDGDGISDGLELQPFRIISGNFSFEEARLDAIAKGGWLARPNTKERLESMARQLRGLNIGMRLWIGGSDMDAPNGIGNQYEDNFRWVDATGRFFDTSVTPAASVGTAFTDTNWGQGQPSNVGNLDGVQLESNFTWSTAALAQKQGYILEVKPTNPVVADSDTDGDGLIDNDERDKYGTDRLKADTDGDALNDGAEISLGTDPRDTDTDNDNLLDGDEVSRGTKPKVLDTDEDGLGDGAEVLTHLTNPLVKDSDGDGISDFDEVTKGSNPNDANNPKNIDTDKEGLKDYEELFVYNTNPTKVDTDGDGLSDYDEVKVYGTDPLLVDTDGDGVDDYREVVILFTDPNGGSFAASSAGSAVSFSEGRGNYEGLLYNSNDGLGFKLTLNVTAKGAFSGSLGGNFGSAPLRGKFMGDGTWSGRITRGNAGFLRMKLAEQDDGSYGVQGSLETPTGGIYYYQARRAIGFPARKLTSEASAIDDAAGPTGSAVATGGIGKGGKVTQQIYNPDGSRATYAGSVLEGEFMALYARTQGGVPTVMLGNVALRNNSDGKSNFDGVVRLFNRNYDQERSLSGAYYSPPTMGTLPLPAMSLTANNALLSWSDGRFDGVNKVASWMPNKVTVPTTQNDKATPLYDRKTGLLKLTYTRTDPAKGLVNAQSNAFAVVVQGKDKLNGFYTGAGSWGGFSVQENSAGLQPDFTNISPLNKTVSAGSISYNVDVTSSGDWTVDTTGASWVTASVKSGTGSGTVVITVNANASNARREASIRIAGFTHTITQSYR
jgi:hypothetical protein